MSRIKDSGLNFGIFNMIRLFQLKDNEMHVYRILAKTPMTIKQLQKATKMSERSLRTHLDDLVARDFVKRKAVEQNHLKYVYFANSSDNLLALLKRQIEDIEKSRLKKRDEIIRGTEEFMKK